MSKIAFVVVSCDKYKDMWDPFFYYLSKNWPDINMNIYLVTNKIKYHCDNVNVTTILTGEDISYSDNLKLALKSIKEENIFLWIEDLFLHKRINKENFENLLVVFLHSKLMCGILR